MYERDTSTIGTERLDQIRDAMERSRNVVLVLTNTFVNSESFLPEVDVAGTSLSQCSVN